MLNTQLKIFALLFVCQFFIITNSVASEIRIAVASNFYPTMKAIVEEFELENNESSKINKGFNEILLLLDKIQGLQIAENSQVLSLDDISVHRYTELKQWDFDYISFSDDESGEIASDIPT